MIEVMIWWGCLEGDSWDKYLINVPTDTSPREFFATTPTLTAIRRALAEFEANVPTSSSGRRITKIDIRDTPDKVLQP